MKKLLLTSLIITSTSLNANPFFDPINNEHANFHTVESLLTIEVSDMDPLSSKFVAGYTQGVIDTGISAGTLCINQNINYKQVENTIEKYVTERSKTESLLKYSANSVILDAMLQKYPCNFENTLQDAKKYFQKLFNY